ncbi:HAD-IB family phosphatase [Chamaesiphon polymorphus]|uniref:2-hydroxy-3-keto-5-methylthiopentenyl-1-phosphate phosphatase n=1 Tax=Chamaesiphon polymorphus CCALA 037 TaxID=2107692 RepID=A0A2T1GB11_9CYAN|nr:HAD-IB family phosphatase [Chamaesiphon polymorphus]PSB54484.1 2-hydroxy-3-keto-5-methylthiopentenyl-1-phosphate phosphatase [Chamaesiphon polymorphus CCALA 037]
MKRIVFCDFDGTITATETFVAMITKFAPEVSALVLPEIYAKRVTLRQGVRKMLELIPSTSYPELIEFTRVQPMRAGFVEFLDFLETEQIPIVIISGGLQGMVESVLQPYLHRIEAIHAIDIDTSGDYLQVNSRYESGTEMVAKAEIMASYHADESIAIGDSITDWNMAMAASIVFARPPLTQYLDERKKPYIKWENFFDIRDALIDL